MQIVLYQYSKRENSTARPGSGTEFAAQLKDACTVLAPTLMLSGFPNPSAYNYVYIPSFARYYFIRDWTYDGGVWYAECAVDVLASWRDYIGSTTAYILRSSAAYNGDIIDTLYPATQSGEVKYASPDGWDTVTDLDDGYYVVGIINADADAVGAVSYYVFNAVQFRALCSYLMDSVDWLDIDASEISKGLQKSLINVFSYIASCMWFPKKPLTTGEVTSVKLGYWTLDGVTCERLSGQTVYTIGNFTVDLPRHPQAGQRGAYLNTPPYTTYTLITGPWGSITLDGAFLSNVSQITCQPYFDAITGESYMLIAPGTGGTPFMEVRGVFGIPIQLASMATNYIAAAGTIASGAGNTLSSLLQFDVGGAITNGVSGIVSGIQAMIPELNTKGSNGSMMSFYFRPRIQAKFRLIVDEYNSDMGRPLCEPRVISSIPGYIMVSTPDISIPCTQVEQSRIKEYMAAGFFYK